ncbi:unnamed protein product [Acanthoscelides obtectus]|uniref:Uncharacterized protein n=1 Tax=Acanthoscelides obtectus TaxID=200917 RepID=A0A9P0K3X3_ACAOB|nr:unnamed protein product [Acanthoscelides obtectus]CAK1633809.1 hypothetical protein AOBTE_LOCUS8405 [Acanthoscelides obtectus]
MIVVDENFDPLIAPSTLQSQSSNVVILKNLVFLNDDSSIGITHGAEEPLPLQDVTFTGQENSQQTETPPALTEKGTVRTRKPKTATKDKLQLKMEQALRNRYVRPGCGDLCKLERIKKINQERRVTLNNDFWKMDWALHKSFILSYCEKREVKRKTIKGPPSQRTMTNI